MKKITTDVLSSPGFYPALAAVLLSAILLFFLHDYYFWPQDEGVFIYIADQINKGQIFGTDVYDIHGGYHAFFNAALLKVFGRDFVVLRYPLLFLSVIQTILAARVMKQHGFWPAFLVGLAATTLGFIQFINPSPGWYALFFAYLCIFIVCKAENYSGKTQSIARNFFLGLLIGTTILFRHPSGIFLGLGVLVFLLSEVSTPRQKTRTPFSRQALSLFLLLCVGLSLIAYNFLVFDVFGFVLFCFWPLAYLALLGKKRDFCDKAVIIPLLSSGAGIILSLLPMVIYQMAWGDVQTWFEQSFLSGLNVKDHDFFATKHYYDLVIQAAIWGVKTTKPLLVLKAFVWFFMMAMVFITGGLTVYNLAKERDIPAYAPIVLCFGFVSYYYQIPFYFYCSTGLFLLLFADLCFRFFPIHRSAIYQSLILFFLGFLCFVPVVTDTVIGHQILGQKYVRSEIDSISLYVDEETEKTYGKLLGIIQERNIADAGMYVFPLNPELYFLAGTQSPFPFFGSSFDILSDHDYEVFLSDLREVNPTLLVFNNDSKYITEYDRRLVSCLQSSQSYRLEKAGEFDVFILAVSAGEKPDICSTEN